MSFPNLVIAGPPKCGTTSLFDWLTDHPEVCGSKVKEPYFLMDKDNPLRWRPCNVHDHGLEAYSSVFPDCTEAHQIIVEATTHYIYQRTALEELRSLPTKPRIVFILRKPSERVFSAYAYSKSNGTIAPDLTFSGFLRLVRNHKYGEPVDWAWGVSAPLVPREIEYSRYADYLCRWRDRLGDDRIRVLLFESMRADPRSFMQELCDWLGIDPSFYDGYDFAPRNRTVPLRSHRLQRLARIVSPRFPAGALKRWVKRLYFTVQEKEAGEVRTPADDVALAELEEEFRPHNERLAREFELDIEAWR